MMGSLSAAPQPAHRTDKKKRCCLLDGTGREAAAPGCSLRDGWSRGGRGELHYSRKTWRAHAPWLLMIAALAQITERSQLWGGGQEEEAEEEEGAPQETGSVAGLGRGDALCC